MTAVRTIRCVDVPGYSQRVVRAYDGPGPVPLATLSVTPDGEIVFKDGPPDDVILAVAMHITDNPDPAL